LRKFIVTLDEGVFIVTLDEGVFGDLQQVARRRDTTIQELLRAIVIPDWNARTVAEGS